MLTPCYGDAMEHPPAHQDEEPEFKHWVVDGALVAEPGVGGMLLGELPSYQLREGAKVLEMTQAAFDDLMNEFYEREGYYPET